LTSQSVAETLIMLASMTVEVAPNFGRFSRNIPQRFEHVGMVEE
jgi:hypothetical protein